METLIPSGSENGEQASGNQGETYTSLTRLATYAEVEGCNRLINDLISSQIGSYSPTGAEQLTKVVGELHDNVASHANGAGFSAAQVYHKDGCKRIEFAIADAGCGMLANVSRVAPQIADESCAIEWCIVKGNTTKSAVDDWAQRLPEDAVVSPYPDSVPTVSNRNHHVGLGLWKLTQLVDAFNGELCVVSGCRTSVGCRYRRNRQDKAVNVPTGWQGVAIELRIEFPLGASATDELEVELEKLGGRLGL